VINAGVRGECIITRLLLGDCKMMCMYFVDF
jgi:hypothetical protein